MEHEVENTLFSGSENDLRVKQQFRIKYECSFDLLKFPFDRQHCDFTMYLIVKQNSTIHLKRDSEWIKYNGPKTIDQFTIEMITSKTGLDVGQTWFIYRISMQGNYMSQVISTFFPTCLLWLLAYFTIFIYIDNFNNRFMGSVTFLLVLVSLHGSIVNGLPKTTYFKYIDFSFYGT